MKTFNLATMKFLTSVILTAALISVAQPANILFYFGIAGHSHVNSLWPVIERAAELGHNVTLLTTFVPKTANPKVNIIYAEDMYKTFADIWDTGSDMIKLRLDNEHVGIWNMAIDTANIACQALMEGPTTQDVIHNTKFDLVIVDSAMNDCAAALAVYKYKAPFIVYAAVSIMAKNHDDWGLPVEASSIPDMQIGFKIPMTFYEKLYTIWNPIKWLFKLKFYYYPALSEIMYKGLGLKERPDLSDLSSKTSLVLHNSHFSHEYARSLPPLVVPISGIQIREKRNPLPKDLAEFINKPGSQGFIYVSFGTVVRISKSKPEYQQKLFRAFGNFSSIQFVWKWEENIPEEGTYPSNIYFSKWLPQQDLLAHNRIKGYIGHGGSNGIIETIHFGVPLISFPFIGDQDYNSNCLEYKGLAIVMEFTDFTQNELETNINKMLIDTEWHKRVKEASKVFRDRPMKPIDTAIWWIEYVLRHKNTSYLMPPGVNQFWYQRRQWDILFPVFIGIFAILLTFSFILYKILSFSLGQKLANKSSELYSNGTRKSKLQ